MLSKDFHFKTQLIRSLEINAENSYKIIIESVFKVNRRAYTELLENDLFKILSKENIHDIFEFFKFSDQEELEEMKMGKRNVFCNFEQSLIHEDLPTVWDRSGLRLAMYKFRDPQNQEEEIVQRITNLGS